MGGDTQLLQLSKYNVGGVTMDNTTRCNCPFRCKETPCGIQAQMSVPVCTVHDDFIMVKTESPDGGFVKNRIPVELCPKYED